MKYKFLRRVALLAVISLPVVIWSLPNFVFSGLTDPHDGTIIVITMMARIWSVQIFSAMLIGYQWPIPQRFPGEESKNFEKKFFKNLWGRALILGLLGGILGAHFLKVSGWWMPLVLAFCPLLQLSLIGLFLGTYIGSSFLRDIPHRDA